MASYTVAQFKIGAHAKKLTANIVDTVTFAEYVEDIEVRSDGAAAIYFTVDGSTPTVGGDNCYELPAIACVRAIDRRNSSGDPTAVKLISVGTPEYSVATI